MVIHGNRWLWVVIHDYVWQYWSYMWLYLTICDYTWLYIVLCGYTWLWVLCIVIHCYIIVYIYTLFIGDYTMLYVVVVVIYVGNG